MPKTLQRGKIRLDMFAADDLPANLAAITLAELADVVPMSCLVLTDNYKFGFAASDTVSQPALCDRVNPKVFDAGNFDASMWFFRYHTPTGVPDLVADLAWTALHIRDTEIVLIERRSSLWASANWAVGQGYIAAPLMCDNPLSPEDAAGYQRFGQAFGLSGDPTYGTVVAA